MSDGVPGYGLDKKKDEKIAVYDLGGGTFDISVLRSADGVSRSKATNGDTHLGVTTGTTESWIGFSTNSKRARMDLRKQPDACSASKKKRKSQDCPLQLAAIRNQSAIHHRDASGPKHISMKLTRSKMEQLCDDLFERTITPSRTA